MVAELVVVLVLVVAVVVVLVLVVALVELVAVVAVRVQGAVGVVATIAAQMDMAHLAVGNASLHLDKRMELHQHLVVWVMLDTTSWSSWYVGRIARCLVAGKSGTAHLVVLGTMYTDSYTDSRQDVGTAVLVYRTGCDLGGLEMTRFRYHLLLVWWQN